MYTHKKAKYPIQLITNKVKQKNLQLLPTTTATATENVERLTGKKGTYTFKSMSKDGGWKLVHPTRHSAGYEVAASIPM